MSSFQGIQQVIDYLLDKPALNDDFEHPLVVLGRSYRHSNPASDNGKGEEQQEEQREEQRDERQDEEAQKDGADTVMTSFDFRGFLDGVTPKSIVPIVPPAAPDWPAEFLSDVQTRLWFTYRSGFPIIPRDENGPSPLSLGSLLRGTLDLSSVSQGFSTDAGWGCMIRTSQSLLANTFLDLYVGRDWRYDPHAKDSKEYEKQWEIIKWFADCPDCPFSIQKIVRYGSEHCGKRAGEWFGPTNAAQSLAYLCEQSYSQCHLHVYLTENGDIYEDSFKKLQFPLMILSASRLGVSSVNPVYWPFLKQLLDMPHSVGIAGGRPSSSHYFFGYQGDNLFYLDPHTPQNALVVGADNDDGDDDDDDDDRLKAEFIPTVHTTKPRKLHLSQMDPSMLIGLLVRSEEDYAALKAVIDAADPMKRFINIYPSRPSFVSSSEPELDNTEKGLGESAFIDLGEREREQLRQEQKEELKKPTPTSTQTDLDFEQEASVIQEQDATETFEEIDKKESFVRPESENGIGKFEKIDI